MSDTCFSLPENVQCVTLTLVFNDVETTFTYAVPASDRDPMDMTLGELMAYPALTAACMLEHLVQSYTASVPRE